MKHHSLFVGLVTMTLPVLGTTGCASEPPDEGTGASAEALTMPPCDLLARREEYAGRIKDTIERRLHAHYLAPGTWVTRVSYENDSIEIQAAVAALPGAASVTVKGIRVDLSSGVTLESNRVHFAATGTVDGIVASDGSLTNARCWAREVFPDTAKVQFVNPATGVIPFEASLSSMAAYRMP